MKQKVEKETIKIIDRMSKMMPSGLTDNEKKNFYSEQLLKATNFHEKRSKWRKEHSLEVNIWINENHELEYKISTKKPNPIRISSDNSHKISSSVEDLVVNIEVTSLKSENPPDKDAVIEALEEVLSQLREETYNHTDSEISHNKKIPPRYRNYT